MRFALTKAYQAQNETNIIILTRHNVPSLNLKGVQFDQGAYIVQDSPVVDYVLAASGSEVAVALEAAKKLPNTRVVSVPCLNKAVKMRSSEKRALFGANIALVTIEASSDYMWFNLHLEKQKNLHLGAYTFGKSMDGPTLYEKKGFTPKIILNALKRFKQ